MPPPNWFIGLPVRAAQLPIATLDTLPPDLRRFHPGDLHVTVAFLGPVDEATALAAWGSADWSGQAPLHARTGARAALGPPRRPSAFGLEIGDDTGAVAAFVRRWRDHLLAAAGRPPERRPVRPHVTLARPRRRGDTIRVREWLAAPPTPTPLTLDRIALYTRAPRQSEQRFHIVRSREFGRVDAIGDDRE